METRGNTPGGPSTLQSREDYEYNHLKQIDGLYNEVITDKTLSYHDSLFKIIIIGDSGIGKSCVLKRLVENEFKEDHDVTVGVEFGSYLIRVQDKILKLQIWDTAGQESFRSITKIFYRGAHAAILAYSVASRDSFESLQGWLKEVKNSCSPDVSVFLIGNKSDINPAKREVSLEEGLEFQRKNNILYFTETSAKSGDNIDRLFIDAAKFIYLKYKDQLHKMIEDETASQTSSHSKNVGALEHQRYMAQYKNNVGGAGGKRAQQQPKGTALRNTSNSQRSGGSSIGQKCCK